MIVGLVLALLVAAVPTGITVYLLAQGRRSDASGFLWGFLAAAFAVSALIIFTAQEATSP